MLQKILITFILILAAAFLFWSSISIQSIFYEAVISIEEYAAQNEILVVATFIVLAALSAMLSPFSSLPLVPAAIMIWGNFLTVIFLLIGWLIGETLTYFIGYYAGYPLVRQLSSFEKVKYYQEKIPKKAEFWLILLFRFSMPAEIPGYALGIIRYNFGKYFLATFLAELPFAFITSYAGNALISDKPIIFISLVALVFSFITLMFYFFNKKLRLKN